MLMFKNHYFVVVHNCFVVWRWFNNFLKIVSCGALHFYMVYFTLKPNHGYVKAPLGGPHTSPYDIIPSKWTSHKSEFENTKKLESRKGEGHSIWCLIGWLIWDFRWFDLLIHIVIWRSCPCYLFRMRLCVYGFVFMRLYSNRHVNFESIAFL